MYRVDNLFFDANNDVFWYLKVLVYGAFRAVYSKRFYPNTKRVVWRNS